MLLFEKKERAMLIFLIVLAISSGVFWGWKHFGQPLPIGADEDFYSRVALSYLEPDSFNYEAEVFHAPIEPLYPAFIAGIYKIFGKNNFDAVRFIQLLLFVLTVIFIYFFSQAAFGRLAGAAAGILSALFYPLAEVAGRFHREILFTFLLALLVISLYKAQKTNSILWFIFAGVEGALIILLNSLAQFLPVFLAFGLILFYRRNFLKERIWLKISVFVLISAIGPFYTFLGSRLQKDGFSAKSAIVLANRKAVIEQIGGDWAGHFVGLAYGYWLAEKIRPGINTGLFLEVDGADKKFVKMRQTQMAYSEIDDELSDGVSPFLFRNFHKFLAVGFLDFLQFNGPIIFNPANLKLGPAQNLFIGGLHPEIPSVLKAAIILAIRMFQWLFFALIVYGLAKNWADWRKFIMPLAIVLYFNIVFSLIYGLARHAIPLYPFYIILFSLGICTFVKKYRYDHLLLRQL